MLYDRSQSGGPRRGVEVDDTDIYWCELTASDGNVVRGAPKNGRGPVRTLGRWYDFAFGRSLVVDDRYVYWLRPEETGLVHRVDKTGANPTTLPLPPGPDGKRFDIGPLAITDDALLLATHGCPYVLRVPKDGSPVTVWPVSPYPNLGVTTGLEMFGGLFYCANGSSIHSLDPATGAVTEIVSGQVRAGPMAMVGGDLYFVNEDRSPAETLEELALLRVGAATPAVLGSTFGFVGRLLYDEPRNALFWTTGLNWQYAEVATYGLGSASPPELLFDNQDVMGNSAADADYLYWLSEHAVTRLRKWP